MTDGPVDDRTIRGFGWVMLGAAALGAISMFRRGFSGPLPWLPVGVGLALVGLAYAAPRALVAPYRAWMALGEALGRITTPVLLSVVFVAVLLPTRLLLALAGKDPLTRRFDRSVTSYWSERSPRGFEREGFERLW